MQALAEAAVRRALERAGNRLKGRAGVLRETLRAAPPMLAPSIAGPSLIADAGLTVDELLEGSWDDVVVRYRKLATVSFDDASGVVGQVIGEWRTGYPRGMRETFAAHLDESVAMFESGLTGIAADRFIDPKGLDEFGELVPAGFVRHVLARAGGTADIAATGYAFVALTGDGSALPGLTTGPVVTGALRDHGATVEAFRWVYGPAQRATPFRPHVRLSGVVFRNFDDPKLANTRGWPPFAFYIPGDHAGCKCDAEPIILAPAEAKALGFAPEVPLTPAQARAAAKQAAIDSAAERFGVSPDEVRAQLPGVKAVRRAIAADAALAQAEAYAQMSRGSLNKAFLPRPPKRFERTGFGTLKRGGEWDWLESLTQEERDRLSRAWYLDGPGLSGVDEIAQGFQDELGGLRNMGASEVMEKVWLPLNRRIEAAGALRKGRIPKGIHYSDGIDANDLAPNVRAEGIDVYKVVGVDDEDAAAYLATLDRDRYSDEAYNLLGASNSAAEGTAPWEMSFQSWEAEVREIEYVMREFPGQVDAPLRQRYRELVPDAIDEPGLDHETLYSSIVQVANVAGRPVSPLARIPWADELGDLSGDPGLDALIDAAERNE